MEIICVLMLGYKGLWDFTRRRKMSQKRLDDKYVSVVVLR